MPGDLTNIFGTGSKPVSYSKDTRIGALQGIFNDNEEFKKRQEEEKKRKEDEDRQREAEQKVREANDKVSKVGVKEVVKELPGAVHKLFNAKNIIPFIEGAQRGALGMLSSTGTFMSQQLKTHPIPQLFKEQADSIAGKIESGSEALDEASALLFEPDTRGTMDKLTDPAYIARGVGDTVTRMLPSLLTGGLTSAATGSTALATVVSSATFAPQIYGDSFKEAKANGLSDEVANEKASVDTLAQAILESFGFSKLFGKSKIPTADFVKRASRRMLELTATEVLTENLQNVAAVMIGKDFGEDKDIQDAIDQIPETTLLTLVTSAFMGGAGEVVVGRNTDTGLVATQEPPKTIPFVDMEQPEPIVPPRREILTPERLAQIEEPIVAPEEILKTVIEQYDTPEAFIKAVENGEIPSEYLSGLETTSNEDLLATEARKYKSAEEFVNSQPIKIYHSTNQDNKDAILREGFKRGSELPEEAFRGGGHGQMQDSISFADNVKDASRFGISQKNTLIEAELKRGSRVIDRTDIEFAEELNDEIPKLIKDGVDAVRIASGEGEIVVINPKAISNITDTFDFRGVEAKDLEKLFKSKSLTKSQLTDIYNQATTERNAKLTEVYNKAKGPKDTSKTKDTVIEEMMQSFAGQRFMSEATGEYSGTKSTFPKWVPSDLRSTELFNKVINDIENKNPPKLGTKRAELYEIVLNEINSREGLPEVKKSELKPFTTRKLQSRVYDRLREERPDLLTEDASYDSINLKKDAQKAVALINKDPAKGYKVAMGMQKPPVGQTATGINIAMAEKALEEGNTTLYSQLVKKRSLDQTRRGQEIVAEKGSVTDNSTSRYVKELISIKLDSLGNKYMSQATDKVTKRSNKIRAMEVLDKEVAKAQKKISGKMLDIKQAQSFLDELSC